MYSVSLPMNGKAKNSSLNILTRHMALPCDTAEDSGEFCKLLACASYFIHVSTLKNEIYVLMNMAELVYAFFFSAFKV